MSKKAKPTEDEELSNADQIFAHAYVKSGFLKGSERYVEAGGEYTGPASMAGISVLRRPKVRAYIKQLQEEAGVEAKEVIAVLARQMRNSIEEFLDENGKVNMSLALRRGVMDQVKSLTFNDEGGVKRLELYSSQGAAIALSRCLGIEQSPRKNDADVQREEKRQVAEELVGYVQKELNCSREEAIERVSAATKGEAREYLDGVAVSPGVQ